MKSDTKKKITIGGMLITLGVVYGDIGTSPLYVMKALVEGNGGLLGIDENFVLGAVSLVFWTLTLLTTVKYVLIALRADNHGEGGIFALYTLVKKRARWLIIPAMLGGAALLADGILTPAVTVTTAMEGLRTVPFFSERFALTQDTIIVIVIIIVSCLFLIQRFGTEKVGKIFGPIMFVWFTTLALLGLMNLTRDLSLVRALSPTYAIELLLSPNNKSGIFILGAVFLATTGAEALYSDMGHVGRDNIYATWPYVKICLVLNYLGQAAWLLSVLNNKEIASIQGMNPFYLMVPEQLTLPLVILATMAAIIASQSLISGSYTLVSEAIKLNMLPRLNTKYPSDSKGQMYIPSVNNFLWIACIGVILYFRTSAHMEAAYGLAITVTMLMTTILLFEYLRMKKHSLLFSGLVVGFFGIIELMFFISSVTKFFHGGFVAAIIALAIYFVMYIWTRGNLVMKKARRSVKLNDYKEQLDQLRNDGKIPYTATNLVYLTSDNEPGQVDYKIMYSILDKQPKRAQVYWFVNVEVTDEPYTTDYHVETFGTDYMIKIQLRLGFRVEQRISYYLRKIVGDLISEGIIQKQPQNYTTEEQRMVGDFYFVLLKEELSRDSILTGFERWVISTKLFLKDFAVIPERWFGLQYSEVQTETVPIALEQRDAIEIQRV